jgi:hypothetical protein
MGTRTVPMALGDDARISVLPNWQVWLEQPSALVLRLALGLSLVGGFGLGTYLLLGLALGLPLGAGTPALIQAHGAVQALGLVPLYVLAVGAQLFPRFHAHALDRPRQVSIGGLLMASGVGLRAVAQPAGDATWRSVSLIAGALLVLIGALLALQALSRVARRGQSQGRGRLLLTLTAGVSLLLAVLLNVAIAISLAGGAAVVSTGLDEAFLHLALWGFGASMILVVGGRVFETLLLLRPERAWLVRPMQISWAVGTFGVPAAWLLAIDVPLLRALAFACQLLGACCFVACHRLFEPAAAASRMPAVTDSARRWARLAFGFLLLAAALGMLLPLGEAISGRPVAGTVLSAARHALAQGFLLPIMVFMGARTLPGYSVWTLRHPRLLASVISMLLLGTGLRAGAELVGGYAPGWSLLVALGAVLGAIGFVVFAVGVWWTMPAARRRSLF